MCLRFVIEGERLNAEPKICFRSSSLQKKLVYYNSKHTLKTMNDGVESKKFPRAKTFNICFGVQTVLHTHMKRVSFLLGTGSNSSEKKGEGKNSAVSEAKARVVAIIKLFQLFIPLFDINSTTAGYSSKYI